MLVENIDYLSQENEFYDLIINRIKKKAKYQKIMLLFDATTNQNTMNKLKKELKKDCVFNAMSINSGDLSEIYNGYKLLIAICSTSSIIKSNIKFSEFDAIFAPTDEFILPYFLDETNHLSRPDNLLILQKSSIDINIYTSIIFNRFFNFISELLYDGASNIEFSFTSFDITQKTLLNLLNSVNSKLEFIDLEIIKKTELDLADLPIVDYVILSAFLSVFQSIKNKSLQLVDTYKIARENDELLNKFYLLATNTQFADIINLNFRKLNTACKLSKNLTLEIIKNNVEINNTKIEKVINQVKSFSVDAKNILSYLYLYNVFGN